MEPECIHVCLIEDDRGDYLLTRKMLSRIEGRTYELDWVSTYEEGEEAVRRCSYDVYLIDYLLGDRDGLELMREAILHGCARPLILLTGQGDMETDRAAMEAGAADYLVKGRIDADTLERSIRYAIERKKSECALLEAHEDLERRVQERTRELARANEALRIEITEREQVQAALRAEIAERKRADEILREQAEALAQADRAKDDFLAMLGHELRNPLGAISNAIEVLRIRDPEPSAGLASVRSILERQAGNMTRLVNDLLDISRITRGKFDLRKAPVDFPEIVGHAVNAVRPVMEEARHTFTVDVPSEPLVLEADPTRLEQVVSNLLHNAAKYTPRGGRVAVSLRREGEEAVLRVSDNGLGLEPDLLPHVFDLFTQSGRNLERSRGGLGLGLTLVRQLVEMHGGGVEVESAGPGQGSTFIVRLPLVEDAAARGRGDAGTPDRRVAASLRRRVLVVDDNTDAAEALVEIVEAWGHTAETVATGEAAVAAVQAQPWDMVVLDIGLPDIDGYEVARRLHSNGDDLPFTLVALTGYGQEEDRRRAHEAGFHHHLTKPVDLPALQRLLEELGK